MTLSMENLTLDELRPHLVQAMLAHVPFDGWSDAALSHAAADLGLSPPHARLAFSEGPRDMVDAFTAKADSDMVAALAERGIGNLKIRDRIAAALMVRLEQALPHREAVRKALAVLALPQNAALSLRTLARTTDAVWRAIGDESTDFNFYTKRAILGAVYSATLLVWLNDDSHNLAETREFLDRRISNVMQIERAKAKLREARVRLPDPLSFLGRLRYPAQ